MRRLCLLAILLVPCLLISAQQATESDSPPEEIEAFEWPEEEEAAGITQEKFSLYGYIVNQFQTHFYWTEDEFQRSTIGDAFGIRLKGDWNPEEHIRFHLESAYYLQVGNQNPYALLDGAGLMSFSQEDFPFHDFNHTLAIDHAWGSVSLGIFDLQFGKMPIAWGTGYVFNPTARTTHTAFLDSISEETPGILGIVPSLAFGRYISLSGYVAFQDKSRKTMVFAEDASWRNMPFGVRFKAIAGSFDLSLSWAKEVLYSELAAAVPGHSGYLRNYYAGADFIGSIWDFGVYGEATVRFPVRQDKELLDMEAYTFFDHFESVLGMEYTIPFINLELRLEYYFQGGGAKDADEYDIMKVLSGEQTVQARHYLFGYIEKPFLDEFSVSGATLVNLNDGSGVFYPEFSYSPLTNFTLYFGGNVFWGKAGSEFRGEYDLYGLGTIDIIENASVYLKLKLSF